MTQSLGRRSVLGLGAAAAAGALMGAVPDRADAAQRVQQVVTRQEVRSLTREQWQRFVEAVKVLHRETTLAGLVSLHSDHMHASYARPAYLPWHRQFLHEFQKALWKVDPSVTLPYWDWVKDGQAPEQSPVLGADYFGSTGASSGGIVKDGAFADWMCTVPDQHPLRRSGEASIPRFLPSPAAESYVAGTGEYDKLRRYLEIAHGGVHDGIGGEHGDMSMRYAPNDPVFWASQCFTDLLWAEWQRRHPSLANTYTNGVGAKPSDPLTPFNVAVSTTFDTTALGYTYPRWASPQTT